MHRFATVPVVLLCVASVFTGATQAAPKWSRSAGLDFWNLGDEGVRLRATATEGQELDAQSERRQQRAEATDRVASLLREGSLTLPDAIEVMTTLASTNPEWFAQLCTSYRAEALVPTTATDRDVVARYLLMKIESMGSTAELLGDTTRTAAISVRLTQLDEECGQQGVRRKT